MPAGRDTLCPAVGQELHVLTLCGPMLTLCRQVVIHCVPALGKNECVGLPWNYSADCNYTKHNVTVSKTKLNSAPLSQNSAHIRI